MISSTVVLLLGLLSFFASAPLLLPIVGLALGINSLLKKPKQNAKIMSIVGTALCALSLIF